MTQRSSALSQRVLGWTVSIAFGVLYAFAVFAAAGNLIGVTQIASELEAQVSSLGWVLLIVEILLPVLLFAAAVLIGRRRGLGIRALLLLTGLGVVSCVMLDILQSFRLGTFFV